MQQKDAGPDGPTRYPAIPAISKFLPFVGMAFELYEINKKAEEIV